MAKRKDWVAAASENWNFSKPLTQTEMAKRGSVSEMAVSKALNQSMENFISLLIEKLHGDFTVMEILISISKLFGIHSQRDFDGFVKTLPGEILYLLENEQEKQIPSAFTKMHKKSNNFRTGK